MAKLLTSVQISLSEGVIYPGDTEVTVRVRATDGSTKTIQRLLPVDHFVSLFRTMVDYAARQIEEEMNKPPLTSSLTS